MYVTGKVVKPLGDRSKVPARPRRTCFFGRSREETLYRRNGSSYNGSWTVTVTVDRGKGEATIRDEFNVSGSMTDTELKRAYDSAVKEAWEVFDGLDQEDETKS
jgi:hypothetical protein